MKLLLPEDRTGSAAFSSVAQALASAGISFRFQAVGQSMYPTILTGEMLHVEPLRGRRLKSGDIVLFRRNGGFKAHRIIQVHGDRFITRGDASLDSDATVRRLQIMGRVVAKECRRTGRLVSLAGLAARAGFRLRRIRSRMRRTWSRQGAAKASLRTFISRSRFDS